jgi:hypothetical protein
MHVAMYVTRTTNESVLQLLVTVNVAPSSQFLVTLMMEAMRSSETSVLITATRHLIPEDCIYDDHRRENLRPYIALTSWALQRKRNVSPVKYELGFLYPRGRHSS